MTTPLLAVKGLVKHFPQGGARLIRREQPVLKAVDGVDVRVRQGHTLGVVGESGSGKTTLALALLRLIRSTGEISFEGSRIDGIGRYAHPKARSAAWRHVAAWPSSA